MADREAETKQEEAVKLRAGKILGGGLGSLDEPATEDFWPDYDPRSKQKKQKSGLKSGLLGASYDSKTYPDQFNYRYMTGPNFNQKGGTCFFSTACNFCKTVVWMHTGKKLVISPEEIYDIAEHFDPGSGSQGGTHYDCVWLLKYTGSNECIKAFQSICRSCGVTTGNLNAGTTTSTKKNAIIVLNEYGPFYWSHHCSFYSAHKYGKDSHAILVVGYDKDKFYWKNSWTSSEADSSSGFGSAPWEDFEEYGNSIGKYHWNLFKKV